MTWARRCHGLTFVVAALAVLLQLVLVIQGGRVLDEEVGPDLVLPGLGVRLARFVAYFTIQSNLLVAATALTLARDPDRDGPGWRVLRLAGVTGITVTGLVHFTLLRPLLDLQGWDWVADKALHMVVPVLAVAGWAAYGPRPRVSARAVALALVWPIGWLVEALLVGLASGWFPYPFLDHREDGWGPVVVACVGVTVLFGVCFGVVALIDTRARPTPDPPAVSGRRSCATR